MFILFRITAFILACCRLSKSKLYTDPSQLSKTEYDFVIIGGEHRSRSLIRLFNFRVAGTAGSVLANRLTEEESFNVLVVEAGVS